MSVERNERATIGERLTAVETVLQMHVKSCDRKQSVVIGLLTAMLASLLSGLGVAWMHLPH